jgi:hypothetical protein
MLPLLAIYRLITEIGPETVVRWRRWEWNLRGPMRRRVLLRLKAS